MLNLNNRLSFHIPGHKGKTPAGFGVSPFMLDTTELPDTDNLYAPGGVIKEAQERAARFYGAAASFFLTNGSTAGVTAAMCACLRPGDKVLIPLNCHASVVSGLVLTGAVPAVIAPEDTGHGFYGGVPAKEIENAFAEYCGIRAVIITSPTYEGIVSDISAISRITQAHNAYLIADAAHGAHFPFSDKFPAYPKDADTVIAGLHKTLPVFGQAALINIHNPALTEKTLSALMLTQTSSPSYLIMSSADFFFGNLWRYDFNAYADTVTDARAELCGLRNIKLFSRTDADITRFVFLYDEGSCAVLKGCLSAAPVNAGAINRAPAAPGITAGIDLEAVYDNYALGISTVADTKYDLDALVRAVTEADRQAPKPCAPVQGHIRPAPVFALTPREAYFSDYKVTAPEDAAGRTAARAVYAVPPGIPILFPGEVITKSVIKYIQKARQSNISLAGLSKGGLPCI